MKPLMLASLFVSMVSGPQLRAQTPTAADSAAIRKAAIGRDGGHVMFLTVVRDTAIVVGSIQRETGPDTTYEKGSTVPTITEGIAFDTWEACVARRNNRWVLVRRKTIQDGKQIDIRSSIAACGL